MWWGQDLMVLPALLKEISVKIIADLTKCHPGTHFETLTRVLEKAGEHGVTDSDVFVIARADQSAVRTAFPQLTQWREVEAERFRVNLAVRAVLNELNSTGSSQEILLLSYDGGILGISGERGWPQLQVTSMPFSALRRLSTPDAVRMNQAGIWPYQQLVDLETALATMVAVLNARGSTSIQSHVKATDLRPAMALVDKRFAGKAILNGTAGLISNLIRIAESRGMIEVDRAVMPKTPLIWLKCEASSSAPAAGNSIAEMPSSTLRDPLGTPASALPPPAQMPATRGVSQPLAKVPAPTEHRSRKLEEVVRSAGMGPYRDARIAMYDAIDAVLAEVKLPTLDCLLSMAQAKAQEALRERGRETEEKQQPWSKVIPFLRRILTGSDVLLGEDNKPIGSGWLANLKRVASLAEKWRAKADSEIVLALITAADDISEDDVSNLAGLLYHGRGDDERQQAIEAVAHLLQSGKAIEELIQSRRFLRPSDNNAVPTSLKMA